MSNNIEITNNPNSGEKEMKACQTETLQSQEMMYHQHRFVVSKPIKVMNIYTQSSYVVIKGLGPMSLVKCEDCGMTFISVLGQVAEMEPPKSVVGHHIKRKRRISFEEAFAAYYNTSQLNVGVNNGQ